MNISIKRVFLLSIWLITSVNSFSQYYVKFKGDSIAFENDSVVLVLDNIVSNNLYWEISKDSVTWESLNNTNDTLVIRINDNSFYRAVLEEGTCYPIKSDVAFAGYKSIEVSDNTVVIDLTGGVYLLPSGIKIAVPPGAVEENTMISFDLLDSISAELKIPFDVNSGRVFCAAIQCEPTQFLKPVKISIPAPNFQYNDIPCVFRFNAATEFWEKYTDKIICSEASQFIEFSTDKLVSTRVQLFKDVFGNNNSVKAADPDPDPDPNKYDCRALLGIIETMAYDHMGQIGKTECYVLSDELKATYPLCIGQPVETAKNIEIGKECIPLVEDDGDRMNCLEKGESATINVKVTVGGMPMKGQEIEFYDIPEGLSIIKTVDLTDTDGKAQFTFTCNVEDFIEPVYYRVNYKYYLKVIQASAGGISETSKEYPKTGVIKKIIRCQRLSSIELTNASIMQLKAGESIKLNWICGDQYGDSMKCEDVECMLVPWGTLPFAGVSVSESGVLSASSGGIASIQLRSGNIESKKPKTVTVAYEGDLPNLGLTSDHNIYKECGCMEDTKVPPYKWKWWVVNYSGSLHVCLYLSPNIIDLPKAQLTGTGTINYSIDESSICTPASFNDVVKSHAVGWLLHPDESGSSGLFSTKDIILGKKFIVEFEYEDFLGFYWHILRGTAKMISDKEILFDIMDYRPDGCIHKDIEGSCILK